MRVEADIGAQEQVRMGEAAEQPGLQPLNAHLHVAPQVGGFGAAAEVQAAVVRGVEVVAQDEILEAVLLPGLPEPAHVGRVVLAFPAEMDVQPASVVALHGVHRGHVAGQVGKIHVIGGHEAVFIGPGAVIGEAQRGEAVLDRLVAVFALGAAGVLAAGRVGVVVCLEAHVGTPLSHCAVLSV